MLINISLFKNDKYKKWTGIILSFFLGQGLLQFINLVTGFFLLRWMSKEDYAQYSIAFGFQSTLSTLIDLGFSGVIIALVGNRIDDKKVLGNYIKSAKFFRNKLFFVLVPLSLFFYYALTHKHNWELSTQILLFASIGVSIYTQGFLSYYNTLLQIKQKIKDSYTPQLYSGCLRLASSYALTFFSALNSITLAWVNVLALLWNGSAFKRLSEGIAEEPKLSDPTIRKEMLRYLSPLLPGIIFTAFQGQISLFIISTFGKSTSIAEIAALGRISQLFVFLSVFNSSIITPYIARIDEKYLSLRYFQFLLAGIGLCTFICLLGYLYPELILWILGPKYNNLKNEIFFTIAGACLGYLGGLVWTINSARRWLFWWGTFAYIAVIITTQLICVAFLDVSSTMGVLNLNIFTAISVLVVQLTISFVGFKQRV